FVELSCVHLGNNLLALNYPKFLPSLNDCETYTPTLQVTD
ncbi:hypothetical protein HUC13_23340, partial [Escherichia coli]|nr:hypothetical protein [Escherichia coli]